MIQGQVSDEVARPLTTGSFNRVYSKLLLQTPLTVAPACVPKPNTAVVIVVDGVTPGTLIEKMPSPAVNGLWELVMIEPFAAS